VVSRVEPFAAVSDIASPIVPSWTRTRGELALAKKTLWLEIVAMADRGNVEKETCVRCCFVSSFVSRAQS